MVASLPVLAKRTVFSGRNHAAKALSRFGFGGGGGGEVRTFGDRLRNRFDDLRVRVALDGRAEGHHEVDVFVAVEIPDVGAVPFFDDDRALAIDGGAARGRVHAFDQRLLGEGEPLAGFGAVCRGQGHFS